MFRIVFVLGLLISHMAIAGDVFKVDPSKSKLEWVGKKVAGQHGGTINLKSGQLIVEKNILTSGEFIIDMTSLVNLDLQDSVYNQKLIGHLKSDDFFSVDKFPAAELKISEVKPYQPKDKNDKNNVMIKGNLTIKGITNPIEFPANFMVHGSMIMAGADITVDRTKWNVRYGSGKFFENLGDKVIYDDFTLKVSLHAVK